MNSFIFSRHLPFANPIVPYLTPLLYVFAVFAAKYLMRNREPFTLKGFSVVHSTFLCIASAVMWSGLLYGALLKASASGSFSLFCDTDTRQSGVVGFWLYIYWLSKFPELLDTAILVLRKKPTIFLHVFHHAIMTLMPWLWMDGNWTLVWFGCWMNCGIHVFMYGYYAAAAAWGYNPWWKKLITTTQIVQFLLVFLSIVLFGITKWMGYPCEGNLNVVWFSQIINTIFLVFFVKFFFDAYRRRKIH